MTADHGAGTRFTSADVPSLQHVSDAELRDAVVRLFDEARRLIAAEGIDTVVLTARRLGCTYELCVREGMQVLQGVQVVSDRWIEALPPEALAGRSVLVIDDSVVVGTTLDRLHRRLSDDVGPSGRVRLLAMCQDTEQRLPYLLEGAELKVLVSCSTERVRRFAKDLVKAFFAGQVPFVSDFPATRPLDIDKAQLAPLLAAEGWCAADVTPPHAAEDGHRAAFSLVPTEDRFTRFTGQLPADVAMLADAYKIRLFVREVDQAYRVVVVPIALLGPARPVELRRIVTQLQGVLGAAGDLGVQETSPEALHRLVQLFVAARGLADFWPAMTDAGAQELAHDVLDEIHVQLYFGSSTDAVLDAFDEIVDRDTWSPRAGDDTTDDELVQPRPRPRPSPLLDRPEVRGLLMDHRRLIDGVGVPERPTPGSLTKVGLLFTSAIIEIFGFIDDRFERTQRSELSELEGRDEYDAWCEQHERLIDLGLTLQELRRELLPSCQPRDVWCRMLLTLGIDTGNDLGIIVPFTTHDPVRDLVHRTYRLGEAADTARGAAIRMAGDDELDDFIEEGLATRPLYSESVRVTEAMAATPALSELEAVRAYHLATDTFRGRYLHLYEGEITEILDDEFVARLEADDGSVRTGRFPLTLVDTRQRERLRTGAPLAWTLIERSAGGGRARTSVLHLFETPQIDVESLLAGARQRGLVGDSDE